LKALVEFSRVGVTIDDTRALSRVDFAVKRGERWAVVGPNGSGKTTLLRVVNGYLRPSSGSVHFNHGGDDVELDRVRRAIGFVSSFLDNLIQDEDSALDVVVSGRYGATRLWEVPEYDAVRRARRLMRLLGCGRFEDRRLSELSQGERQKILIARAMMPDPVLLTFDEPCASLDLGARELFLRGLEAVARENKGLAMVYVTHRIDEIPSVFTHALLLRHGRVVSSGPMNEVMTERNLSKCFGIGVSIKKWNNRFYPVVSG
jgi:iron complex transport system ATP-binding protein